MKRSQKCTAAGFAAVALAAASAQAQTLVYNFETLYDNTDTINPAGTRPDDFHNNGGGTTVTQSTIGVTNGSFSMQVTQVGGQTFSGAQTEVVPAVINSANTTALSFDLTIPATGNFVGNFARMGASEFGNNDTDPQNPVDGAQVQTLANEEVNIDLAPGTYHLTIPLIAISNPLTGDSPAPFSSCFSTDPTSTTTLVPASFEFYFNKTTQSPLLVYIDNVTALGPTTNATWSHTTGGSWGTLGDWNPGIPQFALDTANLTTAITTDSTVTLDGNRSVAALNISNTHHYTIASGTGGTLTLDAGGSNTSTITNSGGTHTISAPVYLNTGTVITVNNSGDLLNLSGGVAGIGSLTVAGNGTTELSGTSTYSGGTTVTSGTLLVGSSTALPTANAVVNIAAGAKMKLATGIGGVTLQLPNITTGGTFDINNDHVFINYATGSDPIASIVSLITSGYNGGSWTGTGITSSAAQTNATIYGIGYADAADAGNPAGLASGQIEIKYTLLGDANLDGKVNGTDFAILATNFNTAVTSWDQGDFNYDHKANGSDFAFISTNFNQGASQAALDAFASANGLLTTSVPEPTSTALLLTAGLGILGNRRRSRR